MKWFRFTAIERGNPAATYQLVAGVDEEVVVETLSEFMDHQAQPTRLESYLFAISIIRRKAGQLFEDRLGHHSFRLTEFVTVSIDPPPGEPVFAKGGLSLWIIS